MSRPAARRSARRADEDRHRRQTPHRAPWPGAGPGAGLPSRGRQRVTIRARSKQNSVFASNSSLRSRRIRSGTGRGVRSDTSFSLSAGPHYPRSAPSEARVQGGVIARTTRWTPLSTRYPRKRGDVRSARRIVPPLRSQPFMPVVAMPWMNVLCARKNRMITGAMIRRLAAIRRCHSVPPC